MYCITRTIHIMAFFVRVSISSVRNVIVGSLKDGSLDLFLNKEHGYSALFCSVTQVCHSLLPCCESLFNSFASPLLERRKQK